MERNLVMNESCKIYRREGLTALALYSVTVAASVYTIEKFPLHGWKIPVAILPILPALLFVRAVLGFLQRADELQSRIHLQALAFAFAGTAILTLTYGFLENVGLPQLNWVWVWPIMGTLWAVGAAMARKKYQ
jgi:hypothetical protein